MKLDSRGCPIIQNLQKNKDKQRFKFKNKQNYICYE